jgi:OOP family OmpA-OmpF porin
MMTRLVLLAALLAACGGDKTPPPVAPTSEAPPVDAAPTEVTIGSNSELIVPGTIAFNMQTGDILPDSTPAIDALATFLAERTDITILRIEGHLAPGVEDEVNTSGALAYEVGKYLLGKGIACQRLLVAAFGSSKPYYDNTTPEGAKNNRITLVVAELRGHAVGGMAVDGDAAVSTNLCSE